MIGKPVRYNGEIVGTVLDVSDGSVNIVIDNNELYSEIRSGNDISFEIVGGANEKIR